MLNGSTAAADDEHVHHSAATEHSVHAEVEPADDDGHDHGVANYCAHRLEVGLSPGLVYLLDESEFTFGLHMHVVARLGESRWGLGVGLERLFDDHGHTTASLVVQLRLIAGWSAILAGGVTLEDGEGFSPLPSLHIETTYEWEIGPMHLGPSLELAIDSEDMHVTLGMHIGFGVD